MSILLSLLGSNVSTGGGSSGPEPLAFQTLGLPRIDSDVYMGGSADYTGPYDVRSATVANAGTNVRINISLKVITTTHFYSDWCIGGVQLYRSGSKTYDWIFNTSTGGTGSAWEKSVGGAYTTAGRPHTVTQANALTYSAISLGGSAQQINWATGTGSSNTGCAGGIPSNVNMNTVTTINQVGANYFAYGESSSPTVLGDVFYMRSPQINVQAGDVIYVAGACATLSSQTIINTFDDAVFIGVA